MSCTHSHLSTDSDPPPPLRLSTIQSRQHPCLRYTHQPPHCLSVSLSLEHSYADDRFRNGPSPPPPNQPLDTQARTSEKTPSLTRSIGNKWPFEQLDPQLSLAGPKERYTAPQRREMSSLHLLFFSFENISDCVGASVLNLSLFPASAINVNAVDLPSDVVAEVRARYLADCKLKILAPNLFISSPRALLNGIKTAFKGRFMPAGVPPNNPLLKPTFFTNKIVSCVNDNLVSMTHVANFTRVVPVITSRLAWAHFLRPTQPSDHARRH